MVDNEAHLISSERLAKADKILFFTHCALGDFTYLQPYLQAFSQKYPHIKIHFWCDEVRRTYFFWRWKYLKNYILFDWLKSCSFFEKLYIQTYSWPLFYKSIKEAQAEEYPIIVSLALFRTKMYGQYARQINPKAFFAGIEDSKKRYHDFDAELPRELPDKKPFEWHTTELYNHYFKTLFGIDLSPQERAPQIIIPAEWRNYGKQQSLSWGVLPTQPVIFINPFAKHNKRCWDIKKLIPLMLRLSEQPKYKEVSFIINTPPQYYESLRKMMYPHWIGRVFLFVGSDNFFQTPSLLQTCDLVISVETSIMHIAAAMKKPLIALMRLKSPEWMPLGQPKEFIVFVRKKDDSIKTITIDEVATAVRRLRISLKQLAE